MYAESFIGRINQLYTESGLSVKDFANKVGISRQTMDFYLNGKRSPSAESLIKISKEFHVTTDWLLAITDTRSQSSDIQSIVNVLHLSEAAAHNMMKLTDEDCNFREPFSYLLEHEEFYSLLSSYRIFYSALHKFYTDKQYKNKEIALRHFNEPDIENGFLTIDMIDAINLYKYRTTQIMDAICGEEQYYFTDEDNDSLDYIDAARKIKEDMYSEMYENPDHKGDNNNAKV